MNKKQLFIVVLVAFFIGGIGSIVLGRLIIPYLATIRGLESLNKLVTTAPIVITRIQQVPSTEGVNLIDLVKQIGSITVTIYDLNDNFLGNGLIVTSDGLIFSSTIVLGKQTSVTVMTNDGQKFTGVIQSKDEKNGLAVITISATGLSTAQFDPAASLATAQRVVHFGRGNVKFEHKAVVGFITQSLENQLGPKQIISDAVVDADYFGGPIVNLSGHVVGMTVTSGQNIISEDLQNALSNYLSTTTNNQ